MDPARTGNACASYCQALISEDSIRLSSVLVLSPQSVTKTNKSIREIHRLCKMKTALKGLGRFIFLQYFSFAHRQLHPSKSLLADIKGDPSEIQLMSFTLVFIFTAHILHSSCLVVLHVNSRWQCSTRHHDCSCQFMRHSQTTASYVNIMIFKRHTVDFVIYYCIIIANINIVNNVPCLFKPK